MHLTPIGKHAVDVTIDLDALCPTYKRGDEVFFCGTVLTREQLGEDESYRFPTLTYGQRFVVDEVDEEHHMVGVALDHRKLLFGKGLISHGTPPSLPGGFAVGGVAYYSGPTILVDDGKCLAHGFAGDVVGPMRMRDHKDWLWVFFHSEGDRLAFGLHRSQLSAMPPDPSADPAHGHLDSLVDAFAAGDGRRYAIGDRVFFTGHSRDLRTGACIAHGQTGVVVCGTFNLICMTALLDEQNAKPRWIPVCFTSEDGSAEVTVHCRSSNVSHQPPPALPGGYRLGETVYLNLGGGVMGGDDVDCDVGAVSFQWRGLGPYDDDGDDDDVPPNGWPASKSVDYFFHGVPGVIVGPADGCACVSVVIGFGKATVSTQRPSLEPDVVLLVKFDASVGQWLDDSQPPVPLSSSYLCRSPPPITDGQRQASAKMKGLVLDHVLKPMMASELRQQLASKEVQLAQALERVQSGLDRGSAQAVRADANLEEVRKERVKAEAALASMRRNAEQRRGPQGGAVQASLKARKRSVDHIAEKEVAARQLCKDIGETQKESRRIKRSILAVMSNAERLVDSDLKELCRFLHRIIDEEHEMDAPKSEGELAECERQRQRKQRAQQARLLKGDSTPVRTSSAGPSHTTPRTKGKAKASPTEAAKVERQQWKEAAPERTAFGQKQQAERHAAKMQREADAEAATAKEAFSKAQTALALASNPKPPKLTVADVAGLAE